MGSSFGFCSQHLRVPCAWAQETESVLLASSTVGTAREAVARERMVKTLVSCILKDWWVDREVSELGMKRVLVWTD